MPAFASASCSMAMQILRCWYIPCIGLQIPVYKQVYCFPFNKNNDKDYNLYEKRQLIFLSLISRYSRPGIIIYGKKKTKSLYGESTNVGTLLGHARLN